MSLCDSRAYVDFPIERIAGYFPTNPMRKDQLLGLLLTFFKRASPDGARLIVKLFRGIKAADLPIERPAKFELVKPQDWQCGGR
jgi:hypothetical protein